METSGPVQAYNGIALPFFFTYTRTPILVLLNVSSGTSRTQLPFQLRMNIVIRSSLFRSLARNGRTVNDSIKLKELVRPRAGLRASRSRQMHRGPTVRVTPKKVDFTSYVSGVLCYFVHRSTETVGSRFRTGEAPSRTQTMSHHQGERSTNPSTTQRYNTTNIHAHTGYSGITGE